MKAGSGPLVEAARTRPAEAPDSLQLVELHLRPSLDGTRIELVHQGPSGGETMELFDAMWWTRLERLRGVLARASTEATRFDEEPLP